MVQYVFGSGVLWGTPLSDYAGNAIAANVAQPVQFGTLQEVSVNISFDTKMLYGQSQFAVAAGRGKGKIEGKAKFAQLNGATFNNIFFGQSVTSAGLADVYDTTGIAIPSTPFTITAGATSDATHTQIPNSGAWVADLGVKNVLGVPMVRVASAPTTGQYSVAAGVYVFASADAGLTVYISYQYNFTSATAKKSVVTNPLMGYAPTFRADLYVPYQGKNLIMTIYNCISTKLNFTTKLEDFVVPELD
jgi:hypothetical protein